MSSNKCSAASELAKRAWSTNREGMMAASKVSLAKAREARSMRARERREREAAEARLPKLTNRDRRIWSSPAEYNPARHRLNAGERRVYNWILASADTGIKRGDLALLVEQHIRPWHTGQMLSQSLYKLRKFDLIQEQV